MNSSVSRFTRLTSFQILEAFSKDDRHFVTSCSQLIAQSDRVVSMPQYEFRNICDTKLESIRTRICSYQQVWKPHIISQFFLSDMTKSLHPPPVFHFFHCQFAEELQNKGSPMFKQASTKPHALGCMDFVPTNFHLNLMQVSCPKSSTSAGRAFSIRFGRKNSFFGLDPDQGWCLPEKLGSLVLWFLTLKISFSLFGGEMDKDCIVLEPVLQYWLTRTMIHTYDKYSRWCNVLKKVFL